MQVASDTPSRKGKRNIYPFNFNTEKSGSSPLHYSYSDSPDKYQLTQTLTLESTEQFATFDNSTIVQPASRKFSFNNFTTSGNSEKNYLPSHFRSNLKLAITSPISKETTENRSLFVETPYSTINDTHTLETVQNTKESLFDNAHNPKKIMNKSMHVGRAQSSSMTNVLSGIFKSNPRQEDKSFISISAVKHWPFESLTPSVSPRYSRSTKRDVVIGPLKRSEFLKETRKTKDFMRYKLTGK